MTHPIVVEARRWIGTPYVHQASCLGAGCDCLGLIRGVWRAIYGAEPDAVPAYSADWAETGDAEQLWNAALRHLDSKSMDVPSVGDVLLFRMRDGAIAKHLGIQSQIGDKPQFIHAFAGHTVVENSLSAPWARRVVARFAFPNSFPGWEI